MLNFRVLIIGLLFLINYTSFSYIEFYKDKTLLINIFGGYGSSSSFFDIHGDQITNQNDTISIDTVKKYNYEFRRWIIGIKAQYSMTDNISIGAVIPLNINSLLEKYERDYEGNVVERASFSLVQPEYFGLTLD